MYYYAYIDLETGLCLGVEECDAPYYEGMEEYVLLDGFYKDYEIRKKYVNGEWIDATVEDAAQAFTRGEVIAIGGEWLDVVLDNKAPLEHTHDGYATADHTHTGYANNDDLQVLRDIIDTKADSTHSHDNYAPTSHSHNNYATTVALDTLGEKVDSKADAVHSHTEYALSAHEHDYAPSNHNHNTFYSPLSHSHDNYVTTTEINAIEAEIDGKLAAKSDISHNHAGVYDVNGAAASALSSANAYTDSKIDAIVGEGASTTLDTIGEISAAIEDNQDAIDLLNSAIANKANVADLNTHASDTELHITEVERNNWNAKSNFSGNYNDLTNKPSIPSINGLATEVYVDTQIDAIDIPSALSDLTTDSTHRVVTDVEKATWNAKSNFSGNYNDLTNKPSIPSISGLATETYVDETVSTKADVGHTHDDRYYTETEINTKLSTKSDSTHNHNSSYDVLGAASDALASAKDYTDTAIADEVAARNSAIATAKSSAISTASSDATTKSNNALASAKTYTDTAVATAKNDLLNGAGSAYDTLKELGDLINENVDAIEALETVAAGKANASHTHTIANVNGLQSALDGKAASSHGTHVSYSTTAPVMDGSASVGTASTVARSDHKHPTDTSRAAQTSLDSHTGNKSNPHGVTLAQLGLTATATELNKLDGITATTTELNYVDGVTSNIQTQLNSKLNLAGGDISGKVNVNNTNSNPFTLRRNSSDTESVSHSLNDNTYTINYVNDETTNRIVFSLSATDTESNGGASPSESSVTILNSNNTSTVTANVFSGNLSGNAATATNVAWSGVTSKPSYYDAKAIKSITRNGTTFTYTCMDGTTGTFTQQDNNTTYSVVTASANGLMSASDKSKLDGMVLATVSEVETYLAI